MVNTNSILRKLRLRELKGNFKSYLSVILIALLSIALFTGLSTNYHNLEEKKNSLYTASNMGDLFVTTTGYDNNEEFDLDYTYLKDNSKQITKRFYSSATLNKSSIIIASYDNKDVSHYASIIEGEDGILISNTLANNYNLKVNDEINITLSYNIKEMKDMLSPYSHNYDYLANNEVLVKLKIDGIMTHSEAIDKTGSNGLIYLAMDKLKDSIYNTLIDYYYSDIELINNVIKTTAEEKINSMNLYNQFVLKNTISKDEIDNYYSLKENNNLLLIMTPKTLPSNSAIESDVIQANQLLWVFPVVFYIVGVLVIITSLSQLINKDKKVIGCMLSLGLSQKQIIANYSIFACLIAFVGGFLGAIIGPLLIPFVMSNKYDILYMLPKASVRIFSIETLLCFVILFLISVLASIFASYKIASFYPSKIFRDDSSASGAKKTSNRFSFIPLPIKMSLRNLKNNLSRSIMVIVGVMGCTALLVCGFGIDNTLDYGINNDIIEKTPYDVYGSVGDSFSIDSLANIDKLQAFELYYEGNTSLISKDVQIDSSIFIYENGDIVKMNYSDTGCSVTTKVANKLSLNVGDVIKFTYNNKYYEAKVERIEESFFHHGIIISNKYLESLAEAYQPNYFYATGDSSEDLLKVELTNIDGLKPSMTMSEFLDRVDSILSGIRLITLTVKIFAIILAVVVIYNLALLNFKERIRDIATLKVLGFGQREVAESLITETLILTVIGSLIGMTLGMPLLKLLLGINQVDAIEYLYHIDILSYLLSLALTVLVSVIINFFITFYTNKIEMVESLKSIE